MWYPTKKLWEIAKTTSWWTPLRSSSNFWWGNIPWLKSWELNDNLKIDFSEEFITEEWLNNSSAKVFRKWTLLIALYWATAWKLWILDFDSTTNQAVCSIQNIKWLFIEKYIFYFLFAKRKQIIKDSFWWAQPNISKWYLDNLKIPLPPLPTQKLIVQKLDSSFEKINKSIQLTKKNLENIEELNKSVLEEVFREWEFEEKTIDEISNNVQYWYTWKTIENWKIKYLRITDIQNNSITWEEVPFVNIKEEEIPKYSLNEWDIVFARTWTVWKSCLIDKNWVWNVFASYLIRIISKLDLINPTYMQYFFYSKRYWEQVYADVVWAAQPNFNWTKLKQIKIPLPTLEKQKEIVKHLDQVFEKNRVLKEKYEKKLKDLEEMKQSLLKEAFEWRLVKE